MRKREQRVCFFYIVLCFIVSITSAGCDGSRKWHEWKSSEGTVLRWRPASPQIGDLVRVETFFPAVNSGLGLDSSLRDSAGTVITPIDTAFTALGRKSFWLVRLTRPGDWSWGTESAVQKLWTVVTVAGDANELKTIDSQSLWSGRGKLASPAGAEQQSSVGAPPNAGSSSGNQPAKAAP